MLALTTTVCVGLALLVSAANKQRRAIALIRHAQGVVEYDYGYTGDPYESPLVRPRCGRFASFFGDELFGRVVYVKLNPRSQGQRELTTVSGWRSIGSLHTLKALELRGMPVGSAGLRELAGLTQLRSLNLGRTRTADDSLVFLKGMRQLETLYLGYNDITDSGLVHLRPLTSLRHLNLARTEITDASVNTLSEFGKLRWLNVIRTNITAEGASQLKHLLPNCQIWYFPKRQVHRGDAVR